MKLAHRVGSVVLIAGSWLVGCADEAPPPAPEPVAAPTPTPPTPMLPPVPAEEELPSAQALPIADDFEAEAASTISADTYLAELDKLETEVSEAEKQPE
jgi:hypothetical protein